MSLCYQLPDYYYYYYATGAPGRHQGEKKSNGNASRNRNEARVRDPVMQAREERVSPMSKTGLWLSATCISMPRPS